MISFLKERLILFSWRRILTVVGIFCLLSLVLFLALFAHARIYQGRVLPGVTLGQVPVGGLNKEEVKNLLQSFTDKLAAQGIEVVFSVENEKKSIRIYPVVITPESSLELIGFDPEKEVERLINFGRNGGVVDEALNALLFRFNQPTFVLSEIKIDREAIKEELKKRVVDYEVLPRDADIIVNSTNPLAYNIVTSTAGTVFLYDLAVQKMIDDWSRLSFPQVDLLAELRQPAITEAMVENIVNRLPKIIEAGGLVLAYTEPQTRRDFVWDLPLSEIISFLQVQKNSSGNVGFGLKKEPVLEFFRNKIAMDVNVAAEEAKFQIGEDGKVEEFLGSRPGVSLDEEQTYTDLNNAFLERTWHDEGVIKEVRLAVKVVEPNIKTGEVNNLGISEVLGVGISDYSNSPTNRKKNIKNAVNKLNGLLIKPDEVFSTLQYTGPFTIAGGYYPELVIKGNELKPEIGGGLCQIGTTLFRTAMNSGMPITERRNHSLVISHYFDPVNNLPGTDATVYDPSPDFKFLNDTGHYLLLQTEMDTKKEELIFTLWGTSDGRKGYYTHPTVSRWISYGEPIETISTTMKPGERKCQNAFRGAEASFTYIRELANGETEKRVFDSYYRPLPKVCLVGAESAVSVCAPDDLTCTVKTETVATSTVVE